MPYLFKETYKNTQKGKPNKVKSSKCFLQKIGRLFGCF